MRQARLRLCAPANEQAQELGFGSALFGLAARPCSLPFGVDRADFGRTIPRRPGVLAYICTENFHDLQMQWLIIMGEFFQCIDRPEPHFRIGNDFDFGICPRLARRSQLLDRLHQETGIEFFLGDVSLPDPRSMSAR